MDVIETVYTDASFNELGTVGNSGINVAYGSENNDFEVTTFADVDIPNGSLVYVRIRRDGKIVGTEYGGMVTKRNPHADSDGKAVVTYDGPSWHGILGNHVVCPPSGSAYLHVTGEANAAIGTVISALGLTGLFAASADASGITVSHDFRYAAGYDGLTAMLSEKSAKLIMAFDGAHVVLSAVDIHDYSTDSEFDQSQVHLNLKIDGNPVNHLICLATGEGVDRIRVDLYADDDGNVSTTQTQFGLTEHAVEYDYTSADVDTLTTDGTKKLKDYQTAATTIEVTVEPSLTEFDVGDIIGAIARSGNTIDTASAYVTYKSATVNGQHLDVTYKAGTVLKTAEEQAAQSQTAQSIAALNEALAAHGTAMTAKSSIDNLQIGGLNLLTGSRGFFGTAWQNLTAWTASGFTADGFAMMYKNGQYAGICQTIAAKAGEQYTISAWVVGNGEENVRVSMTNGEDSKVSPAIVDIGQIGSTAKRISATVSVLEDVTLWMRIETWNSSPLAIWGMKMERGNRPTDWSPAPSDSHLYLSADPNPTAMDTGQKYTNISSGKTYTVVDK